MEINVKFTYPELCKIIETIVENGANDRLLDLFTENVEVEGDNIYILSNAFMNEMQINIDPPAVISMLNQMPSIVDRKSSVERNEQHMLGLLNRTLLKNTRHYMNMKEIYIIPQAIPIE